MSDQTKIIALKRKIESFIDDEMDNLSPRNQLALLQELRDHIDREIDDIEVEEEETEEEEEE